MHTPASRGTEAIHAAGLVVNGQRLESTEAIRRAIPIARRAAAVVKSRSESTGWRVGRYTDLPIAIYQNWLYEMNRDWRFTDGTLCVLWCVEFPDARSDYPNRWHYIASTRGEYNRGRHQAPAPAIPCVGYDITGKPVSTPIAGQPVAAIDQPPPLGAHAVLSAKAQLMVRTAPSSGSGAALPPRDPPKFRFRSDRSATAARIADLDAYMKRHVLGTNGFCCLDYDACRASHSGAFFEGQLHHVGAHYDLTLDGQPFRIAVIGQEYGNGPARVTRLLRSRDVVTVTGYEKRFKSDGLHAARNPHMKGTTSVLRLLTGRAVGTDYESELLQLDDSAVHVFEAFALTNFLLCTAIPAGLGDVGSKRGKSTPTMQRNCARHFREAMRILEPTVLIVQGKGTRGWMNGVLERAQVLSPTLERVQLAGRECLLATFTHPSVPSVENWGTDERRPYLQTVVRPTVARIHQLVTGE